MVKNIGPVLIDSLAFGNGLRIHIRGWSRQIYKIRVAAFAAHR
jgi:hypothetical protein